MEHKESVRSSKSKLFSDSIYTIRFFFLEVEVSSEKPHQLKDDSVINLAIFRALYLPYLVIQLLFEAWLW